MLMCGSCASTLYNIKEVTLRLPRPLHICILLPPMMKLRRIITLALGIAAASAQNPQLRGNNAKTDATPLNQLKDAAETIGMRFRTAETSKTFGNGLNTKLVDEVKRDSEEFWKDVQLLTPQDTQTLTQEDAKDLQHVVQEVAQMDDDINNAKRQGQVQSEYDTIRSELADVNI